MVVPVEAGGKGEREGGPGRTSGESPKPRIISELMKKHVPEGAEGAVVPERRGRKTTSHKTANIYSYSPETGDRPRMSGVLQCARSEWTPRWEARYAEIKHGSLELYLPEGGGPPSCGTRPRRRLPLRNLSIRRIPRRHHAFALCPREAHAAPLLLCQADDAEGFSRWTRTLAVELMRQTPLGDVRFLDILRITETPRSDDPEDPRNCGGRSEGDGEAEPEEVERLKDLCQKGSATVTERRRLFEALGGGRPSTWNRGVGDGQRNQLSSRSCASSEDLGQSVMKYPSLPRTRPKRAKSLHDLPSDFPVSCTMEGGIPVPISIVSQLRLFFERISQNGTVAQEGEWCVGGAESSKEAGEEDKRQGKSLDSCSGWVAGMNSNCVKGQPKKTGRSQSYTCESTRKLSNDCCASYGSDNVFLNNVSQKLCKDVYRGRGLRGVGVECDNGVNEVVLNMHTKERNKKGDDLNRYTKHEAISRSCNSVKMNPIITQINPIRVASSSLSNFSHSSSSSHPYPSSPPHSLSSDSSTFSFLPLATSPSSSCSSLSMQLSTPSSSPPSQLSQQHFLLSSIKKQASESEETIWGLQEEMARLDWQRMAAQRDKKIYVMETCPERSYSELEVKLQEEELKLDKLYKEAERVLKCIERSVEQEATLALVDQHSSGKNWHELECNQKFNSGNFNTS